MKQAVFGKKIIRLDHVNSTNEMARQLSSYIRPIEEGTVVVTDNQLFGKGRRSKKWISEPGKNLMMSVILYPSFLSANKLFFMSKAFAVAASRALNKIADYPFDIKWPNDIYVNGYKIGGILIENSWKGNQLGETIVGIGINVNQVDFTGLDRKITSLNLLLNKEIDLELALRLVLSEMEEMYDMLKKGLYEDIDATYASLLYRKGDLTAFLHGEENFKGVIEGVDEAGKLVIQVKGKGEVRFEMDELHFIS